MLNQVLHISDITFSGGQRVPLQPGMTLLLVGPNGSGKSAALREIRSFLMPSSERLQSEVLSHVVFNVVDPNELLVWLKARYPSYETDTQVRMKLRTSETIFQSTIASEQLASVAFQALVQLLDTESRLTYANSCSTIDLHRQAALSPIHWLQKSDSLRRRVFGLIRLAFGQDLIINWGRGAQVGLHVGVEPERTMENDRVSQWYLEELEKQPRLEVAGDGIRSFVATLLAVEAGEHPVLLVDEPEAFLHPPQAARLGKIVGQLMTERNRQAVIATHSADFIRGVLAAKGNVAVCRIERDGNVNSASLLGSEEIAELWSSPLLRSSQAISGLFHEGVVVCEADADCRFYETVLEHVKELFTRPIDLYFVHGGGIGALPSLAKAYTSLSVKTVVIADLDLLRTSDDFFAVYECLAGTRAEIEPLYSQVCKCFADQCPKLDISGLLREFDKLLKNIEKAGKVSSSNREQASHLLEQAADWSEPKKHGIDTLRSQPRQDAIELLKTLKVRGLFLVPCGELESFWKDGPSKKSKWIAGSIEQFQREPSSFAEAQSFVTQLCEYFGYQTTQKPTN